MDFFPPVVDDAWTWGAVAAVNAMSDVYAMGGEVLFALAVAGFPRDMSKAIIAEVFRGGAEKVAEAGGVIAGGHTVVDAEPKYGLCVTGRVHPDRVFIKGGLRPGDRLFLSKPLGTGVITTAAKNERRRRRRRSQGAVDSMLRLNRVAAQVARQCGATGRDRHHRLRPARPRAARWSRPPGRGSRARGVAPAAPAGRARARRGRASSAAA